MTKDEYFHKALANHISSSPDRGCLNYAAEMATEESVAFAAGFNAACEYYRKYVLDL